MSVARQPHEPKVGGYPRAISKEPETRLKAWTGSHKGPRKPDEVQ